MRAKILIEEMGDDVGFCLIVQSTWCEDSQFKIAQRSTGEKMSGAVIAEGLRSLAEWIELESVGRNRFQDAIEKARRIES